MRRLALQPAPPGRTAGPGWLAWAALALLAGAAVAAAQQGVAGGRIVMLLLLAPLVEEALFRAGLHEALLRRRGMPLLANVATALSFGVAHALLHGDPAALAVALPALLIGSVYQRTRRVRDCALLHAVMNALWLAGGLIGLPHVITP